MQFRVIMITDPHTHTNPQTGPITIHCADKHSTHCKHTCITAMSTNNG